jgi:signal peptidase II
MSAPSAKARIFLPIFITWLTLDLVTKHFAMKHLWPPGVPHEVVGEYLRFTLAFNRGAAMGMSLGDFSRPAFTIIGLVLLSGLGWLLYKTREDQRLQTAIIAFIMAGAVGTLVDRLRHERGVTDFIDAGIGTMRFWTFNVADMGITCGAIALALILGKEEKAAPKTQSPKAPTAA